MTISVIIPIYNLSEYLRQCVDSVLCQNFDDFEVILVDDGSIDDCVAIVDEYAAKDVRVKAIHKKNGGSSSARNAGLDVAEGDYVIFLDSDDWWNSRDCLETLYRAACSTGADIVRGSYVRRNESGIYEGGWFCPEPLPEYQNVVLDTNSFIKYVLCGHYFSWLFLLKKESIGEIRFNGNLIYQEDVDFMFHIMTLPIKCLYVPLPFYSYRFRSGSMICINSVLKLKSAFNVTALLYSYSDRCSSESQKSFYIRKAVVFYRDLFCRSLPAEPFYSNTRGIASELKLNKFNRDVRRWMKESSLICGMLPFYLLLTLPSAFAVTLLHLRQSIARLHNK